MAATLVQSAEGTSTLATVTASFPSTPTNGNLIILRFAADDYNGTPNTGWTQSTGMEQQTYHGGYLWWKIASGGSNSFQYTIGSATNSSWTLEEWSGLEASPYDTSNGQSAVSSSGSYTTPSITPSAGDRLLLAAIGSSNSSGDMSADLTGWTNSFTGTACSGPASATGTRDNIGGAYLAVTANGSTSYSTGASFPFTKTSHSGMIIAFKVASGGSNYTISADPGAVTITGTAATPKADRKVDATSGSLTITGTAASLSLGRKVAADAGSVSIAGTDAGFTLGRKAIADPGTVAISGQDASLKTERKIVADAGGISITGTDAGFTLGRTLTADPGSVSIAGQDAGLKATRLIAANDGTIVITGSDATLTKASSSVLVASPGSIAITGADASLKIGRYLAANDGSIQITGTDANLAKTSNEKRLVADPGSIQIVGSDVSFIAPNRAGFTSSGGVGTTWHNKTLSQIEREKKAALKRAKKRIVEIIQADPPQLAELLQIVREEVRQEAVEFPSTVINDIISRLHMQMRAALIRRIEEEDEADAEFLLLVA